jgi:hypothetical protein
MPHLGLISLILLIVGGINWGLVGLLDVNLVTMLFGSVPILVTVVYALVGLAGLYQLYLLIKSRS